MTSKNHDTPGGWVSCELRDLLLRTFGGGTPSTKHPAYWEGEIPWITTKWLGDAIHLDSGEKRISAEAVANSATKLVPTGNVLFATRVGVGKAAVTSIQLAINQDLAALIVDRSKVIPEFLAYHLRIESFQRYIESNKRGATIKGITKKCLLDGIVSAPGLLEQRKISAFLMAAQRAVEQQEQAIALTSELKKAMMHKLFTQGMRGEVQRETEIGLVPESWELVQLKQTGEVVYGIQAAVANNLMPIGTKILTNKNITLDGRIDLTKINYFELKNNRHMQTLLRHGDLLFNWRSGSKQHVGKTAFYDLGDGEFTHSSFILRIRPNRRVNSRFLYYYLNWLRESDYFVKLQTYAVNAKFNKSAVNALPTILPKLDEQGRIVEAIDAVHRKLENHRSKKVQCHDLLRSLLHLLMTAEIRVDQVDMSELESIGIEVD